MGWRVRVRDLPLRTKLVVTVIGAALALLGLSTHLSFRYWKGEALAAAEQQALLAAGSVRAAVESSLVDGRQQAARRNLRRLVDNAAVTMARVYAPDGTIVVSAEQSEEGRRLSGVWIPAASEIPGTGLVRPTSTREAVRAYLPLHVGNATVLEVEFSVAPLQAAMDRGARIGIGLLVGSLLALLAILFTMFEREVVGPIDRLAGLLDRSPDALPARPEVSLDRIEASVAELIEEEQKAKRHAKEQTRRLEAQAGLAEVGEMAAEMAHEFKRPLASIRTAIDLLEQEYALESGGKRLLGSVDNQLEKLAETMQDLFSLARPIELEREEVVVAEVLDGAVAQLTTHPASAGIEVERRYGDRSLLVWGDGRRLEQAVLNVMLNAAEAMSGGGSLIIEAERLADGRIRLSFADTGVGIPKEEVERVMKPFYSTKPLGTGLGLPLVARVVAAHGGRLDIVSRPGEGTRVVIELPAPEATAEG